MPWLHLHIFRNHPVLSIKNGKRDLVSKPLSVRDGYTILCTTDKILAFFIHFERNSSHINEVCIQFSKFVTVVSSRQRQS